MIRNLTPHPVRLYPFTAPDVVGPGDTPERVFPVAGPPARLAMKEVPDHPQAHLYPVETVMVEYGAAAGLPPQSGPGDRVVYYLVSLPLALALPERTDLLVPYREVRDGSGTVVGCRALARPVPEPPVTMVARLVAGMTDEDLAGLGEAIGGWSRSEVDVMRDSARQVVGVRLAEEVTR